MDSDLDMTVTPEFRCEVGDILEVNWCNHSRRVKVIGIITGDSSSMAINLRETKTMPRRERRGNAKSSEKYYLKFARRRSYL